jgi:mannose-1-phosphate guanylyltransferase
MKAIILAAGEGKRLRPFTENMPKCLLPINGKPLLEYWLDGLEMHKFSQVLVNGHYLPDILESYLTRAQRRYAFKIRYVYEAQLLGTGGTLKQNYAFVKNEEFFLVCHGDNFTNLNISDFVRFHRDKAAKLSVALYETNVPKQCGIVEQMDNRGRILKFVEKPDHPRSNLASAAIFLMSPDIIAYFPDEKVFDFSNKVLPLCQGEMFGYLINGFNIDIGTPDNYKLANKIVAEGNFNLLS